MTSVTSPRRRRRAITPIPPVCASDRTQQGSHDRRLVVDAGGHGTTLTHATSTHAETAHATRRLAYERHRSTVDFDDARNTGITQGSAHRAAAAPTRPSRRPAPQRRTGEPAHSAAAPGDQQPGRAQPRQGNGEPGTASPHGAAGCGGVINSPGTTTASLRPSSPGWSGSACRSPPARPVRPCR